MNLCYRALRNFARIGKLFVIAALMLLALSVQSQQLFGQAPAKTARKVVVRVEPEYPDFFRNGHFEARVIAEATVLPNGSVSSVEIKGGNPMFAEFATKALMKWKYVPAPVQTVEQVVFNFRTNPR
ncbi:MAG TPA: energy transducer TonB [Candidatus Sulfotelmatobacter sp.]|nr:energy transducer TonB [Candidatus Sulfotelmatobacter sp.]